LLRTISDFAYSPESENPAKIKTTVDPPKMYITASPTEYDDNVDLATTISSRAVESPPGENAEGTDFACRLETQEARPRRRLQSVRQRRTPRRNTLIIWT
jgi:hypothetical protein